MDAPDPTPAEADRVTIVESSLPGISLDVNQIQLSVTAPQSEVTGTDPFVSVASAAAPVPQPYTPIYFRAKRSEKHILNQYGSALQVLDNAGGAQVVRLTATQRPASMTTGSLNAKQAQWSFQGGFGAAVRNINPTSLGYVFDQLDWDRVLP